MGQACRTASGQDSSSITARAKVSVAKASARPSEDASERRSAKAQDLTPPVAPHVVPVLRAADTENEPSSACGPMDNGNAQANPASDDHVQIRLSTPAPSSPDD